MSFIFVLFILSTFFSFLADDGLILIVASTYSFNKEEKQRAMLFLLVFTAV